MIVYGWIILGDVAMKRVNGQEVVVMAGRAGDIEAVIKAWEDTDRRRMLYGLGSLARLADAAMTRLRLHHRTPNGRGKHAPETGDTR